MISKTICFFNCYLAFPRPTLDHYQNGQPDSPNVNHCNIQFWLEGHQEVCNELESLSGECESISTPQPTIFKLRKGYNI